MDPVGVGGRRRAPVPRIDRERRRRDERRRRLRRADRRVGDRGDARIHHRAAAIDRRPAARGVDDGTHDRAARGRAARGRRPRTDRPGHGHTRARPRHVGHPRRPAAATHTRRSATCSASTQLHRALADADHVLDALPLTEQTRGLFDAAAFAAMPARARFYNVGTRGHGRRARARRGAAGRHDRRRSPRRLRDRAAAGREPAVGDAERDRLAPHQRRRRGVGRPCGVGLRRERPHGSPRASRSRTSSTRKPATARASRQRPTAEDFPRVRPHVAMEADERARDPSGRSSTTLRSPRTSAPWSSC